MALRKAVQEVRIKHPFTVNAWVLLPEHLHCIWTLPEGDQDYSLRWSLIKAGFSRETTRLRHGQESIGESRRKHREKSLWQRRFWEHRIRDEQDYQSHFDTVHFNPLRHGLVARVQDWPFSTFHAYVKLGIYPEDWGGRAQALEDDRGFGE